MGQEQGRAGEAVRALYVPYVRDTYDLSRLITVSRNRCSTAVSCTCHVVPKLLINICISSGPRLRDDFRSHTTPVGYQGTGHPLASAPEA